MTSITPFHIHYYLRPANFSNLNKITKASKLLLLYMLSSSVKRAKASRTVSMTTTDGLLNLVHCFNWCRLTRGFRKLVRRSLSRTAAFCPADVLFLKTYMSSQKLGDRRDTVLCCDSASPVAGADALSKAALALCAYHPPTAHRQDLPISRAYGVRNWTVGTEVTAEWWVLLFPVTAP